jgi:hypothetical protein
VSFSKDGKDFLLEPLLSPAGLRPPRLSVIQYKPKFSMAWDGEDISFFAHAHRKFDASRARVASFVFEWLFFWTYF